MRNWMQDLRYAMRLLRMNPGFAAGAVLTLALGIGASTSVFSVVNAVLLRPLAGVAEPSRLFSVSRIQAGQTFNNFSHPDYQDFHARGSGVADFAAHIPAAISFDDGASAERLIGDLVTSNYFSVLGVAPSAGRLLSADDDASAVISYGLWKRRFALAPGAIGSKVSLNGHPFTIVGVAPEGFGGTVATSPFDLWTPLRTQPQLLARLGADILENRSAGWLSLFARLRPGVTLPQLDAGLKAIAGQLAQAYPTTNDKRSASVAPGVGMFPDDRAEIGGLLTLLSAAVLLLLVIGCANVAGLLMVRSVGRTREIAIRMAIGAGRSRILRQLLIEGVVLALLSGVLGVMLAAWSTQLFVAKASTIASIKTDVDWRVLLFALVASAMTGILFALLPAAQCLKVDLTDSLKSGLAGAGISRSWLRQALVAGQVALSFALLSSALLLLSGLYRLIQSRPGFDLNGVAMASVDLTLDQYTEERGVSFYQELLQRLKADPEVASASLSGSVPPSEYPGTAAIFYPGREPVRAEFEGRYFELGRHVSLNRILPGYFETLRIPILRGRDFVSREPTPAVIVSQMLANALWPGEDAIGKRIAYPVWGGAARAPFEVVGVAADVKHLSLAREAPQLLYVPLLQEYDGRAKVAVRMRSGDSASGAAAIRRAVASIDKRLAVYRVETGDEHLAASLWQQRMASSWIGAFSALALVLAAVGLYGVIAQFVAQRTREVGIRIALGATQNVIASLVLKQGLWLVAAGVCLGVPIALLFDRLMRGRLAGIGEQTLAGFGGIALLLTIVMLAACLIPARRASRVDPMAALRCE